MMQEYVDVLLSFVSQNIGFSHGKPVAAFTIYKCLIHWKLFEAEKTSIFDRIVPLFRSAIEVNMKSALMYSVLEKQLSLEVDIMLMHSFHFTESGR